MENFLTIIAILISPFLAVYAQSIIEHRKERRDQKIWIFKTLMSTRATPLDSFHVQALNMVTLEFSEKKKEEKEVLDAWKVLMDNFNDVINTPESEEEKAAYQIKLENWSQANQDNLINLLDKMIKCLGYSYDKVHLKRGIYYPKGHGDVEQELRALRLSLLDLTTGHKSLRVSLENEGIRE